MLQRKLEREYVLYGGAPPPSDSTAEGSDQYNEDDENGEQVPSVSGTIWLTDLPCLTWHVY